MSDISGQEAEESEFTKLVIRSHPHVEGARQLDVLKSEVEKIKGADNLVTLEIGDNGDRRELVLSLTDFRKMVKDDVAQAAPGTRGRRPGFSPSSKS